MFHDIPADTRYLALSGSPLTQAAVEQLERAWAGEDLADAEWFARVVIAHGVGDQRFAHDVAIGRLKAYPTGGTGIVFRELVALRIADITDTERQNTLRELPFALLMF